VSFLDVIEAVEGPIALNVCLDGEDACAKRPACTMASVWEEGQAKMLEVYRAAKLADLALRPNPDGDIGFVRLGAAAEGESATDAAAIAAVASDPAAVAEPAPAAEPWPRQA
jgi:hypothetical protein